MRCGDPPRQKGTVCPAMPQEYLAERSADGPLRDLLDRMIAELGYGPEERNEAHRRLETNGIWAAARFARTLTEKTAVHEGCMPCDHYCTTRDSLGSVEPRHAEYDEYPPCFVGDDSRHLDQLDVQEIPKHPDLAGANAFVRNGQVKLVGLADGQTVVAKRGMADATSRLNVEIGNGRKLKCLIRSANPDRSTPGRRVTVEVITPFRILGMPDDGVIYALSEYVGSQNLEDALLFSSGDQRRTCIADYVEILSTLLDLHVLWNDLSPRNILIRDAKEGRYALIDFEKTSFSPRPLSARERTSFIRGNCVSEELAIFVTAEELTEHLGSRFDFSNWDFSSKCDVPFHPRSDVVDLIHSLDLPLEQGTYNKVDELLIRVRSMQRQPDGRRFHPGRITTRLQHVLTSYPNDAPRSYDLRVNEILLSAPDMRSLSSCSKTLSDLVTDLEVKAFAQDVETFILTGTTNRNSLDESALTRTLGAIDALWHPLDRDQLRAKIVEHRNG